MAKSGTLHKTHKEYQMRLRLLGLTEAEEDTFLALLRKDPAGVSEIARAAKMSRTTVDAALRRLARRGLVRKLPHSYKSMWKVRELNKLKSAAAETIEYMEKENAEDRAEKKEIIGRIDAENIGIEVFKGIPQIKRIYSEILKIGRAERVYFIQGNTAAKTELRDVEEEFIRAFHAKLKRRGVIIEGITGEAILGLFKEMKKPFLESHFGRMIVGYIVPDEYMNFGLDIIIMRDRAFFVSLEQRLVIVIRFAPLVDALLSIAAALAALGRKVDLNAYLRGLIEKKSGE